MTERLQKIIAAAGICSRRAAETLIQEGKVTVNGVTAQLGESADVTCDNIEVQGKPIKKSIDKKYIMLNKPCGFVTTMSDEKGRKNVSMLVNCGERVYPVGRLDLNSQGLLIMTNDGELANQLMHPKHNVDKTYFVKVSGNTNNIESLSQPMDIDGYIIRPAQIKILHETDTGADIEMTIHEGRNRQIRKMCALCGFKVLELKRISVGDLKLDKGLRPGAWRYLQKNEIQYLKNAK